MAFNNSYCRYIIAQLDACILVYIVNMSHHLRMSKLAPCSTILTFVGICGDAALSCLQPDLERLDL